jgi:hypothetical protein
MKYSIGYVELLRQDKQCFYVDSSKRQSIRRGDADQKQEGQDYGCLGLSERRREGRFL